MTTTNLAPNFGIGLEDGTAPWAQFAQRPFAVMWKTTFFDLPLAFVAQTMRFSARRLEAQADYLANLNNCKSVPEMVEAQSHFIQKATGDLGVETGRFLEEVRAKIVTQAA